MNPCLENGKSLSLYSETSAVVYKHGSAMILEKRRGSKAELFMDYNCRYEEFKPVRTQYGPVHASK